MGKLETPAPGPYGVGLDGLQDPVRSYGTVIQG